MLASSLSRWGDTPAISGASFWTDAAVLGYAGIPPFFLVQVAPACTRRKSTSLSRTSSCAGMRWSNWLEGSVWTG